jgi:hypothetical protein
VKIYLIVEGHGEVSAAPVLMRRLLWDCAQAYGLDIGSPVIRRTQSQLQRDVDVQSAVRLALAQPDCAAVLVLFDGEDHCPVELAAQVRAWACAVAGQVPCEVVIAYREYETWLLAAVDSLRGQCRIAANAQAPANPELKRDAKGELEAFMPPGASYSPTIHQPRLSAVFDMSLAHQRNRSFRKLTKAVGDLMLALGQPAPLWPPAGW